MDVEDVEDMEAVRSSLSVSTAVRWRIRNNSLVHRRHRLLSYVLDFKINYVLIT